MARFGDLEASIMDVLWGSEAPVRVREVSDQLNQDRPLAFNTVQTVMENLFYKGWLTRRKNGRAYWYEAARSRDDYIAKLLEEALSARPRPGSDSGAAGWRDGSSGDRIAARGAGCGRGAGDDVTASAIAAVLLLYAAGAVVAGSRWLPRGSWAMRAPRTAIATWQAATTSIVGSVVTAGVALAVPCLSCTLTAGISRPCPGKCGPSI